jgi:membrane associated rhomboid family serine protease
MFGLWVALHLLRNIDENLAMQIWRILSLVPQLLIENFYLWQPVTSVFMHIDMWHLLFNLYFLWWFGRMVEDELGGRRLLVLFFSGGIVASLVFGVSEYVMGTRYAMGLGASGAINALMLVAALRNPRRQLSLLGLVPMTLLTFALILVGLDIMRVISSAGGGVAVAAHLGGAAWGWLWFQYADRLERHIRMRAVIDHQKRIANLRDEVDRILDKVREQGMHSLTSREKKTLNEGSNAFRDRDR